MSDHPGPRATPVAPIGELVRASQAASSAPASAPAPQPEAKPPTDFEITPAVTSVSLGPPERALLATRARRVQEIHLSPGEIIPGTRYRLLKWLGDGGMGVVYEAQHVDIERRVAVKILRSDVCDHPRAVKLFRDEARAVGKIGSEFIVEVFDFAELPDQRLLLAMELLVGRPLSRELAGKPMAPARVIPILRQVCKGLASAHAAHIIHRDVKPDNIFLLDRHSRRDAVKLLDFGIATFLVEATATEVNVVGTPQYLAPEIAAGKPFDARVDMYSLGCMGFEMLTGRPPFDGSLDELLYAHINTKPPSLAALRGDDEVPARLIAVISRCMAKRPEDRYTDMHDLEAALCEAQIAAKIETEWDDLPLPQVDVERRDLLLRQMPEPPGASLVVPQTRRRGYLAAALGGVLAVVAVIVAVQAFTGSPPAAEDPELARYEAEARAAAARAAYVYPPSDDLGVRTAFQVIRELEGERGPRTRAARELARDLRREFAGTLGAFGDRLWEREGGLEFAVDAYAQALLFDPDLEPAASRASLTPGQLARLASKAAAATFSEAELIAVEPLVVLAESEKIADSPALAGVRERVARRTRERDGAGVALASATPRPKETPGPADPTPEPPHDATTPPTSEAPTQPATDPAPEPPAGPGETRRDPEAAARLVQQAQAAAREGREGEAERLFERALAQDARNADALHALVELYFNRGAYARALAFGGRALRATPGDAGLHLLVGDAAFKSFQYDEARRKYERARELGHPEAASRLEKLAAKVRD